MIEDREKNIQLDKREAEPYRRRLPGFVITVDVGLGDVVKHVTSSFGMQLCGSCERRATLLNRWVVFTGKADSYTPAGFSSGSPILK